MESIAKRKRKNRGAASSSEPVHTWLIHNRFRVAGYKTSGGRKVRAERRGTEYREQAEEARPEEEDEQEMSCWC